MNGSVRERSQWAQEAYNLERFWGTSADTGRPLHELTDGEYPREGERWIDRLPTGWEDYLHG